MLKQNLIRAVLSAGAILASSAHAADVRITEWMYNPNSGKGEFIEFTNLGNTAVNFEGWSEDDSTGVAGTHDLSSFGVVNPGESVILTEVEPSDFRTNWNLSASVKVIGGYSNDNLGRQDEINLYDTSGALVDQLTFDDQGGGTQKGPRTAGTSGRPGSAAALGANNASLWVLSSVGDVDGTYKAASGDIGSPGRTAFPAAAPVPLPAAAWLLVSGLGALTPAMRRRKQAKQA